MTFTSPGRAEFTLKLGYVGAAKAEAASAETSNIEDRMAVTDILPFSRVSWVDIEGLWVVMLRMSSSTDYLCQPGRKSLLSFPCL